MRKHLLTTITCFTTILFAATTQAGQPPEGVRVVCTAEPKVAAPGTVVDLAIEIQLPPGWITYDIEQVANSVMPTRITLDRSPDFAPLQGYSARIALETRDPVFKNRVVRYFAESPTFHRPIVLDKGVKPGALKVSGRIDFQVLEPATGKYYVVQQTPFRTSLEIRRDDASTEQANLPEQVDTIALPEAPVLAGPADELAPSRTDATLTHKPILDEPLPLPSAAPLTAEVPPATTPSESPPPATAISGKENNAGTLALPAMPVLETPVEQQAAVPREPKSLTLPLAEPIKKTTSPSSVPKPESTLASPVRNASAITIEIKRGDLEIPFATSFGDAQTKAFHWESIEETSHSPVVLPILVGVVLALLVFSVPELLGQTWMETGLRLTGMVPMLGVAGGLLLCPDWLYNPVLAGIAGGMASLLLRKPSVPSNRSAGLSIAALTGLALTIGGQVGDSTGPLFAVAGFVVGGGAAVLSKLTESTRTLGWFADRVAILDPPGFRLLAAYSLIGLAAYFLGRADYLDGRSDWIGYRSVVGCWCALSGMALVQTMLPVREAIASLREKPERLFVILILATMTLSFASHLFAAAAPSLDH